MNIMNVNAYIFNNFPIIELEFDNKIKDPDNSIKVSHANKRNNKFLFSAPVTEI